MKKRMIAMALVVLWLACAAGCAVSGGTVSTDGSTSMSKVMGALGEAFENKTGLHVSYNPTGSGTGIQAVLEGRCDIGLSSRELKDSEKESGLRQTVLAWDAIAVIVHPQCPVSDLTIAQIRDIFTGAITDWSQLGGEAGQIVLIGREANSGTRDGFESVTDTQGACKYRQELSSNGDVITAVAGNPNAIGYASLSAVRDSVKAVRVDGVTPGEDTVLSGSYALRRPFALITREAEPLSEAAQKFMDYALSEEAEAVISAAGAVPAGAKA